MIHIPNDRIKGRLRAAVEFLLNTVKLDDNIENGKRNIIIHELNTAKYYLQDENTIFHYEFLSVLEDNTKIKGTVLAKSKNEAKTKVVDKLNENYFLPVKNITIHETDDDVVYFKVH